MSDFKKKPQAMTCRRCGTCCRNGPPALHGPDKELYAAGCLNRSHLVTFRQGERVHDNVQDKVQRLDREMVRIRSGPGSRSCIFYDHGQRSCRIYHRRPNECRVFTCWDPGPLLHMYTIERVQRLDLISSHSALGQIIAQHENMCSWARVIEILPGVHKDPAGNLAEELARVLKADRNIRLELRERAGASQEELDFILGRDMASVLPGLGLRVHRARSGYRFQGTAGQPAGSISE